MRLESDVVLIGTGLAPLVAAQQFLRQGKSAFILNPERDFFGENSELPFDPLFPTRTENLGPERLHESQPSRMLSTLQPEFPGAIQSWPSSLPVRDPHGTFLRTRSRLWMKAQRQEEWDALEGMYLRALDCGLKPQILEGLAAWSRFPGTTGAKSRRVDSLRGLVLPQFGDFDVSRFRTSLREFLKERLGSNRMVTGCTPIEIIEEGIRFREDGVPRTVRVNDGVLIYWTPKLSHWIEGLAARYEVRPALPEGIRIWEEWDLVSKEALDPEFIGTYGDLTAWAAVDGAPVIGRALNNLKVLHPGNIVPISASRGGLDARLNAQLASEDSFRYISHLCEDFLGWDRFTVRSMGYRMLFEWGRQPGSFILHRGGFEVRVFSRADGPVSSVVAAARNSSERFMEELGPWTA